MDVVRGFASPKQVRVGTDGTATATITVPAGTRWRVLRTSVSTSTKVLKPSATLYAGTAVSAASYIEDTGKGYGDVSDTVHLLNGGESITCYWAGADVGALATIVLAGEQQQTAV